ncbi:TOC34 [Scenedesmus sp. PABB004]|nr:TOC34 [Scenedesmus sp. PABB004]
MSGKQRKLRTKLSFADDEEADGAAVGAAPPAPPASAQPARGAQQRPSKLLSFGDDEEELPLGGGGGGGKAKKDKRDRERPAKSKFHRAGLGAAPPPAAAPPAAAPPAGEYSAERLAELAAATQRLPSKLKPPPAAPSAAAAATAAAAAGGAGGGVVKLTGSFKAVHVKDDRFSYSITGAIGRGVSEQQQQQQQPGGGGGGDAMPLPPPPRPAGGAPGAAAAAAAGGGSEEEEEDDADGCLPDAETIRRGAAAGTPAARPPLRAPRLTAAPSTRARPAPHRRLAKEKRERLRQAHLAPDYVPLGGASRLLGSAAAGSGLGPGRGGRWGGGGAGDGDASNGGAGDGSGSGSEGGSGAGSDGEQELEERMRLAFDGEDEGEADMELDGASHARGGEAGALARAMRRNAAGKAGGGGGGGGGAAVWARPSGRPGGGGPGQDRAAAIRAAGAGVLAELQAASARAAARHKNIAANLARTADSLAGALEEAERVRADIAASGERYAAVQGLKAYLADLADCLASKAPLVEELQDSLLAAAEDAAQAAMRQEQDDARILFAQAEAAVVAALQVLGGGGGAPVAAAAAAAAAAEAGGAAVAAAARGPDGQPEVDEFGRDLGLMRRKELAAGEGRRAAAVAGLLAQLEGMRAGGRMDLEASASLAAAAAAAGGAAANGAAPGAAPSPAAAAAAAYARRRAEVAELAPTVFADADEAYATLAAVKGRLEAFKAAHPGEYRSAYIGESAAALFAPFLFEFGLAPPQNGGAAAAPPPGAADADANVVPQLVESLVLPLALHLVSRCWDPCCPAQSRAVLALVSDLFVYVPSDRDDMAQLLAATTAALEGAAGGAAVPPWPAAAAGASREAAAALQLRFARAVALLRGLVGFADLLGPALARRLGLQGLLCAQLVPCLRSSMAELGVAVARAEAVAAALPASWLAAREAQPLHDVLASLGRSVLQQRCRAPAGPGPAQQQRGGRIVPCGGAARGRTARAAAGVAARATAAPHISVIATDVDGTLLNSSQQLTPRVEAAVRAAGDAGVPLIVATGKARGPWVPSVLPRLGSSSRLPGVFLQGLLIADADGNVLRSQTLPDDVVESCIAIAAERRVTLAAYCHDRIFVATTDEHTDRLLFYAEPTPEPVGDLAAHLLGAREVHKLIWLAPQHEIDAMRPAAEDALRGRATCTTALSGMLEVLPLGASKGAGVAWLLGELGLDAGGLLALGDGENDIEMLRLAALGVAMGNAGPAVRAAADVAVAPNDADGVAEAIERYVLAPRGLSLGAPVPRTAAAARAAAAMSGQEVIEDALESGEYEEEYEEEYEDEEEEEEAEAEPEPAAAAAAGPAAAAAAAARAAAAAAAGGDEQLSEGDEDEDGASDEEEEEESDDDNEVAQDWNALRVMPEGGELVELLRSFKASGRRQLTVLLLGKSGVGKSSTVNSMLGEKAAPVSAFKLQPDTESSVSYLRQVSLGDGELDGFRVKIIDTCGLEDPEAGDTVNYAALQRIAEDMKGVPVDVVLYVDRLDLYRVEPLDKRIMQSISETFGRRIWHKTLLVLTHGNLPLPPPGTTFGAAPRAPARPWRRPRRRLRQRRTRARAHRAARAPAAETFTERRIALLRRAVRGTFFKPALPAALAENGEACKVDAQRCRVLPDGSRWLSELWRDAAELALAGAPYAWSKGLSRRPNSSFKWIIPLVAYGQYMAWKTLLQPALRREEDKVSAADEAAWAAKAAERKRLGIGPPLRPTPDNAWRLEQMYDDD